jgi:hypothetical protein
MDKQISRWARCYFRNDSNRSSHFAHGQTLLRLLGKKSIDDVVFSQDEAAVLRYLLMGMDTNTEAYIESIVSSAGMQNLQASRLRAENATRGWVGAAVSVNALPIMAAYDYVATLDTVATLLDNLESKVVEIEQDTPDQVFLQMDEHIPHPNRSPWNLSEQLAPSTTERTGKEGALAKYLENQIDDATNLLYQYPIMDMLSGVYHGLYIVRYSTTAPNLMGLGINHVLDGRGDSADALVRLGVSRSVLDRMTYVHAPAAERDIAKLAPFTSGASAYTGTPYDLWTLTNQLRTPMLSPLVSELDAAGMTLLGMYHSGRMGACFKEATSLMDTWTRKLERICEMYYLKRTYQTDAYLPSNRQPREKHLVDINDKSKFEEARVRLAAKCPAGTFKIAHLKDGQRVMAHKMTIGQKLLTGNVMPDSYSHIADSRLLNFNVADVDYVTCEKPSIVLARSNIMSESVDTHDKDYKYYEGPADPVGANPLYLYDDDGGDIESPESPPPDDDDGYGDREHKDHQDHKDSTTQDPDRSDAARASTDQPVEELPTDAGH